MRKFIDIIASATLLEGRDAYLFHGTDLAAAIGILRTDTLDGNRQYDHNPLGVSLTRDYRIARDFGTYWERQFPVVFVLDQQKLVRSRHKLLPRLDSFESGDHPPREAEEMVLGDLPSLNTFLVSINVHPAHIRDALHDREYQDWMNEERDIPRKELLSGIKALARHPLLNAWLPRVQWAKGSEQIPIQESAPMRSEDEYAYHATFARYLPGIRQHGLTPNSGRAPNFDGFPVQGKLWKSLTDAGTKTRGNQ